MLKALKLGLLGQNIQHSQSPRLQSLNASVSGRGLNYVLYDLKYAQAERFLQNQAIVSDQVLISELNGLNVTTPYKELAFQISDHRTSEVELLQAANTLVYRGGLLYSHNTDPLGASELLTHLNLQDQCSSVILLGTGGASRAVALSLAQDLGCEELVWVSRDKARAVRCLEQCSRFRPSLRHVWIDAKGTDTPFICSSVGEITEPVDASQLLRQRSVIISGAPPLSVQQWCALERILASHLGHRFGLHAEGTIVDLNYSKERLEGVTAYGQRTGLRVEGGLYMLVGQGVASFNWWTGAQLDAPAQWSALQSL